ncbi:MAG: J domain-containing protein [Bacteroidia bacterium]
MPQTNYYLLLGVVSTATTEEIKSAYRALAKKYHPDKNQGNKSAEEYFKEIQEAYAVLSNPEKRRKYDLKFSYASNNYSQQKTSSSSRPYTGNAYQYAQQTAQDKQRQYTSAQQTRKTKKKDNSEGIQIIVSVGIALILLYFIISYSTDNPKKNQPDLAQTETPIVRPEAVPVPAISDYASPYSGFFGEEISDNASKNSLDIHNSYESEAVVCLVQNQKPFKTIRNQYMSKGSEFKMNEIPDGEYFLKIYYGTDWDPAKIFSKDGSVKGGFKNEIGFFELNTGKDLFIMKQEQAGTSRSFSSYEIGISPAKNEKVKTISAEEFFK